jgi:regulatory protein spx
MIRIYTSPSCSSCRKVKKWFEDNKIPYEAKNIFAANLTAEELKDVISKTENGTDDIISLRSKVVQENNIDFDEMTISQLVEFIRANPSVLKRPIIVDDHRIQVGYNEEEIRTFIPRARRLAESLCGPNCEQWGYCNMSLLEGAGCPTGDVEKK